MKHVFVRKCRASKLRSNTQVRIDLRFFWGEAQVEAARRLLGRVCLGERYHLDQCSASDHHELILVKRQMDGAESYLISSRRPLNVSGLPTKCA